MTGTPSGDAAIRLTVTLMILCSSSVLLGAQLTAYTAGHAEIRLTPKPEYTQHMGVANGGVVSYAADTALAFAGGSVLVVSSGAMIFTPEYKINYVKPARGDLLIARASSLPPAHSRRSAGAMSGP